MDAVMARAGDQHWHTRHAARTFSALDTMYRSLRRQRHDFAARTDRYIEDVPIRSEHARIEQARCRDLIR